MPKMNIKVSSFGYKYDADYSGFDLVFDLRQKLRNPVSHLPKGAIGLDKLVIKTVLGSDQNKKIFDKIFKRLTDLIKESQGDVSVAFGCRSGIHRSVVFAEECARLLRKQKLAVEVQHIHLKT